ncbi:hypothetical protein [Halopseudomonas sabulinigri]|uniref:hypothetical protein n=1 Tax=Halopseudomonas sabulinigri TaxID=472181 RepID=UPI0012FDE2F3|nr:hypothetical protein [Halopseudomonas sabulinigri]
MGYAIFGAWTGKLFVILPSRTPGGLDIEGENIIWGFVFYCCISAAFLVYSFPSTKPGKRLISISSDEEGIARAFGGFYKRAHHQLALGLVVIGAAIMFAGLFYAAH